MQLKNGSLKNDYEEKGFIVVPDVLKSDEIALYKTRTSAVVRGEYPDEAKGRLMRDIRVAKGLVPTPDDPEDEMWKILNPDRFDITFRDFLYTPKILDVLELLLGPDLICFLLMVIYKPRKIESVHPLHQDAYYFPFGPHDNILGVWVPLDDTDEDNGGLQVIPGSHKGSLREHEMPGTLTNAFAYEVENARSSPETVALKVQAGSAVFFHSRLMHTTRSNFSEKMRRVLTLHACSAQCTLQPDATIDELGMTLVRGKTHSGCVQPNLNTSLAVSLGDDALNRP